MNEPKKYWVYYHLNVISLKIYIGITSQRLSARWGAHGQGYKNNIHFWNSIQKYGWNEGFIHGFIYKDLSKEEALQKERELIAVYNANDPEWGYNQTEGGEGSSGWKMTEEQKQQLHLRLAKQFDTPEKRKLWGEKHKGHYVSEECKRKISEHHKGKGNPMARGVVCITTGDCFDTIKEGAIWANLKSYSKVGDACKNHQKSAGKHPLTGEKLYWRYQDEL